MNMIRREEKQTLAALKRRQARSFVTLSEAKIESCESVKRLQTDLVRRVKHSVRKLAVSHSVSFQLSMAQEGTAFEASSAKQAQEFTLKVRRRRLEIQHAASLIAVPNECFDEAKNIHTKEGATLIRASEASGVALGRPLACFCYCCHKFTDRIEFCACGHVVACSTRCLKTLGAKSRHCCKTIEAFAKVAVLDFVQNHKYFPFANLVYIDDSCEECVGTPIAVETALQLAHHSEVATTLGVGVTNESVKFVCHNPYMTSVLLKAAAASLMRNRSKLHNEKPETDSIIDDAPLRVLV